ncbi:MAG: RNA methyltransferase [Clostridia bacterium]|nr:RNA methyltransferase [Clostridia bacterium]
MKDIIRIEDFSDPALDVYVRLTGAQLRRSKESEKGIFIAESPTVIDVALASGCKPISLLTDSRLINSDVADVIGRCRAHGATIYTAEREMLTRLTGFELTRGALCAMKRPDMPTVEEVCAGKHRIAVLEAVTDSTNIGAAFRSAAALGIDGVLVTPTCCDPLCRRALRVSMGTVLRVPWTVIGRSNEDWPGEGMNVLHALGFKTVAMALTDDSVGIDDPVLMAEERLAIILGTEGDGLARETIASCDYTAKIPMSAGVDSLNVAAAGAVAFWQLRYKKG